jgi:hypothetical protein
MGAMACDRDGCEHIMCNRLILRGDYYICNDCYNELQEYKETWRPPMTERDVEDKIVEFMRTEPGTYKKLEAEDIDKLFKRLTENYDS